MLITPNLSLRKQQQLKKENHYEYLDMKRVATIILGGGCGTRLYPLTMTRCKPAISFGGHYSLIDIPISNAINSNCRKIFIITQFLASSVHDHIFTTYRPDSFYDGFIRVLSSEQKPEHQQWFHGTADAVRQNLNHFVDTPADYFLILSGDQVYNMDFHEMVKFGKETDADLVIASLPIEARDVSRMGILDVNEKYEVVDFHEKPKDHATVEKIKIRKSLSEKLDFLINKERKFIGSMGIYLFKRQALIDLLQHTNYEDFGKHLIPEKVKKGKVSAFIYDGYWEDIGTIESFYNANMALTRKEVAFDFYDEVNPIYTRQQMLPGTRIHNTHLSNSIICEGGIIEADRIANSILGPRTIIKRGTSISNSYIMGNEFYNPPVPHTLRFADQLFVGEDCTIKNAILDQNVCIGNHVQLINKDNLSHYDGNSICIRDGIIVVMRGAHIQEGFIL